MRERVKEIARKLCIKGKRQKDAREVKYRHQPDTTRYVYSRRASGAQYNQQTRVAASVRSEQQAAVHVAKVGFSAMLRKAQSQAHLASMEHKNWNLGNIFARCSMK